MFGFEIASYRSFSDGIKNDATESSLED